MARMVNCVKLGREAEGLDFPPLPGELGKKVFENVSKEAWQQWLEHSKMLINEYRLDLTLKKSHEVLKEQCELFLFGEGAAEDHVEGDGKSLLVGDADLLFGEVVLDGGIPCGFDR